MRIWQGLENTGARASENTWRPAGAQGNWQKRDRFHSFFTNSFYGPTFGGEVAIFGADPKPLGQQEADVNQDVSSQRHFAQVLDHLYE